MREISSDEMEESASSSSSSSSSSSWNTEGSQKCSVDGDSGSSNNSTSSIGDDDDVHPRRVEGCKLKREAHKNRKSAGLRVTCMRHGATCRRLRALEKDVDVFGVQSPALYLGCWLKGGDGRTLAEHRKFFPTRG